jgi:hypothetical protein
MGLGKTLTTLSTIIATVNQAEGSFQAYYAPSSRKRTKAILIILPDEGTTAKPA